MNAAAPSLRPHTSRLHKSDPRTLGDALHMHPSVRTGRTYTGHMFRAGCFGPGVSGRVRTTRVKPSYTSRTRYRVRDSLPAGPRSSPACQFSTRGHVTKRQRGHVTKRQRGHVTKRQRGHVTKRQRGHVTKRWHGRRSAPSAHQHSRGKFRITGRVAGLH
jgi:hypothetical protein